MNRSRKPSFQHRNFRRNYGVSAAHGEGQTLLPLPGHNQINSSHLQNANNPLSSSPELTSRVPTSTTTSISSNINNYQRSHAASQVQGGAGDIDMAFQVVQLAT